MTDVTGDNSEQQAERKGKTKFNSFRKKAVKRGGEGGGYRTTETDVLQLTHLLMGFLFQGRLSYFMYVFKKKKITLIYQSGSEHHKELDHHATKDHYWQSESNDVTTFSTYH